MIDPSTVSIETSVVSNWSFDEKLYSRLDIPLTHYKVIALVVLKDT